VGINALGDDFFWLRPIVKLGAIAGLTSVVLVLLYGQSRIFYTMARDGMLPGAFAKVHSKYRTPYVTTLVTGAAAIFFSGLFPIGLLGEMVSIGTLLAFVIVCVSVMVLRYSKPKLHRPFKTPLMPFVPIMGALVSLAQMFALPQDTWMRLLIWMFIGFIIYGLYGERHARKKPTRPDDGPIIS
nr:amino acid permease [Spirochaetota bacterium]